MAFDGITTAGIAAQLRETLVGGGISRIIQPEKDELLITIKNQKTQYLLLMSANASLPLIYLTDTKKEAPMTAPNFCMLLRKHIQGGQITAVTQPSLERIIELEILHRDELGDLKTKKLIIELMGKYSNIIFTDDGDQIIDSIKRVPSSVSSVREVLPGRLYFVPDTRNKRDPLTETEESFDALLRSEQVPPAKLLMSTYTGISTQMAEELCYRAALSNDRSASSMTAEDRTSLWSEFHGLMEDVRDGRFTPCIYYKLEEGGRRGAPVGYAAVPMRVYADFSGQFEEVRFESMSELLETFYAQKNEVTRIRQKSVDLRRIVQTILERDVHKYDLQLKQIRDTEKRDKYRVYGELLNAYGYSVPAGAKSCELDNYYTGEKIRVPLDPTLTPMQNAKKYFDRYTKLKRTNEALTALTAEVKSEIDHLESIRTSLDLATNEGDLAQIRQELEDSGLVRRHSGSSAKKKPGFDKSGSKKGRARTPVSKPLHYISSDGYDIYVGKNNTQNDALTFHFADPDDIWMHANDMPGSHVILRAGGKSMEEIPDRAFEEAASLAAWYSAGREQGKVEIDYLLRRNVKKPGGAKPGFVVYYTNYSILARADITGLQEAD